MKAIIELGISILLLAVLTKSLPLILKKAHKGQYIILKEANTSKWGKVWIPKLEHK